MSRTQLVAVLSLAIVSTAILTAGTTLMFVMSLYPLAPSPLALTKEEEKKLVGVIESCSERIAKLERGASAANPPGEVRAKRFLVEDDDGKVRAMLFTIKDGNGALVLLDEEGAQVATLSTDKDGWPALVLTGKRSKAGVSLGVDKDDGSGLVLTDNRGTGRVVLAVNRDSGSLLGLSDENGTSRFEVGVQKGVGGLTMSDGTSQPRFGLSVDGSGDARMDFLDHKNGRRAGIGLKEGTGATLYLCAEGGDPSIGMIAPNDGPILTMTDAKGQHRANLDGNGLSLRDDSMKIRAWLNLDRDGTPGLAIFGPDGKPRWKAP